MRTSELSQGQDGWQRRMWNVEGGQGTHGSVQKKYKVTDGFLYHSHMSLSASLCACSGDYQNCLSLKTECLMCWDPGAWPERQNWELLLTSAAGDRSHLGKLLGRTLWWGWWGHCHKLRPAVAWIVLITLKALSWMLGIGIKGVNFPTFECSSSKYTLSIFLKERNEW